MTDTYQEIMSRLMALYEKAPERFLRFYDAVWLMCHELPEGQQFRIADRCSSKSIPLFRDIVSICIMEEPWDDYKGILQLSDDQEYVCRSIGMRPPRPAPPDRSPNKG